MTNKILLLILFSLFHTHLNYAQDNIEGQINDANTLEILAGANIQVVGSNVATVSDENGYFALSDIQAGKKIAISFLSYKTLEIEISEKTTFLYVSLESNDLHLNEIVVSAYNSNKKLLETAGAVAVLDKKEIQRLDNVSLLPALNSVAGVKMEMKSMGSYRLAMRNSLLRSPWSIRNIKMYWNGISLTDASGENPINNIDLQALGNIEVLKGPASSLYGANTGGVLLFNSQKNTTNSNKFELNSTFGSFGLRQITALAQTQTQNANINISYTNRHWDGYRQHENHDLDALNLYAQFFVSPKRTLNLMTLYADTRFQISGSINADNVAEDPQQFGGQSQDYNASVDKQRAIIGLGQNYRFNRNWQNNTSINVFYERKESPFGTSQFYNGFKRNSGNGFGLRSVFVNEKSFLDDKITAKTTFGTEYLNSFLANKVYDNWLGVPGEIEADNELIFRQLSSFIQSELELPKSFFVTLGGSYNLVNFRIDEFNPNRLDSLTFSQQKNLSPIFSPRLALVKKINDNIAAHASLSYGFASPLSEEMILPNGNINEDLTAETGVNYEIGMRGSILNKWLNFDVSYYYFPKDNEIVSDGQRPATYLNVGKTLNQGLESAIYSAWQDDTKTHWLQYAKVWASHTFQQFTFVEYGDSVQNVNNTISGTSPQMLALGFDAKTKVGFYLNTQFNYYDKMPLNNANSEFADAYSLLNLKIGQTFNFKAFYFNVYFGINNLTDTAYTSFHAFNDYQRGKYFNPSPSRNFYGGFRLGVDL
ncbi:MAG: TonB-dependent receptor [Chitinophagales bacterium]